MKPEDPWVGMEVYIEKLRPYNNFQCEKREAGLEGVIVAPYSGWKDNCWVVRHSDGTTGVYFYDEIECIHFLYWYKVRKMYGYI